jgi:hypothetical protein
MTARRRSPRHHPAFAGARRRVGGIRRARFRARRRCTLSRPCREGHRRQEPGSATDKVARTAAAALEKHWGSPVIVENRPGAGGTIGADVVAKAPTDGYTLLLGGYSNMIVAPAMRDDIRYDVTRDFAAFAASRSCRSSSRCIRRCRRRRCPSSSRSRARSRAR